MALLSYLQKFPTDKTYLWIYFGENLSVGQGQTLLEGQFVFIKNGSPITIKIISSAGVEYDIDSAYFEAIIKRVTFVADLKKFGSEGSRSNSLCAINQTNDATILRPKYEDIESTFHIHFEGDGSTYKVLFNDMYDSGWLTTPAELGTICLDYVKVAGFIKDSSDIVLLSGMGDKNLDIDENVEELYAFIKAHGPVSGYALPCAGISYINEQGKTVAELETSITKDTEIGAFLYQGEDFLTVDSYYVRKGQVIYFNWNSTNYYFTTYDSAGTFRTVTNSTDISKITKDLYSFEEWNKQYGLYYACMASGDSKILNGSRYANRTCDGLFNSAGTRVLTFSTGVYEIIFDKKTICGGTNKQLLKIAGYFHDGVFTEKIDCYININSVGPVSSYSINTTSAPDKSLSLQPLNSVQVYIHYGRTIITSAGEIREGQFVFVKRTGTDTYEIKSVDPYGVEFDVPAANYVDVKLTIMHIRDFNREIKNMYDSGISYSEYSSVDACLGLYDPTTLQLLVDFAGSGSNYIVQFSDCYVGAVSPSTDLYEYLEVYSFRLGANVVIVGNHPELYPNGLVIPTNAYEGPATEYFINTSLDL